MFKKNRNPYLDTLSIFNEIRLGVTSSFPMMGELKAANHQKGGSFLLFLKDTSLAPDTGNIKIYVQSEGNLFINGRFIKHISMGSETFFSLSHGEYIIEIFYITGEKETQTVIIKSDETHKVDFTHVPGDPVVLPGSPGPVKNHFIWSLGLGLPIPIGRIGDFMEIGYSPAMTLTYSLCHDWGNILLGVISGLTIESVKSSYTEPYTMYSIPAGITIGYRSVFLDPFFIFAHAIGGLSINYFMYYPGSGHTDSMVVTTFAGPQAGFGWTLFPAVSVSVYGSCVLIFFTNEIYMNITPGIRCEINIR